MHTWKYDRPFFFGAQTNGRSILLMPAATPFDRVFQCTWSFAFVRSRGLAFRTALQKSQNLGKVWFFRLVILIIFTEMTRNIERRETNMHLWCLIYIIFNAISFSYSPDFDTNVIYSSVIFRLCLWISGSSHVRNIFWIIK